MITLSNLKNTSRQAKRTKKVGRGPGSQRGKTCCRGTKGDKARSGYKRRLGQEGGQLPLFRKMPKRGFSNARFRLESFSINLELIDQRYEDGETVSLATLQEKGLAPRHVPGGVKVLGNGELTKKVAIEVQRYSKSAREKLEKGSISFKDVPLKSQEK